MNPCRFLIWCRQLLVCLLFATANAPAQPASIPAHPNSEAFERETRGIAQLLRLPGFSLAVVQDGKIVCEQTEGFADLESKTPINKDSIFWLASVTKTFSSVLMMQYEQEEIISLDDPMMQYPFASVGFFPQRITPTVRLKHLLSHTSEGNPGEVFVYNGGRFGFIYGVFERMSGLKAPLALPHELDARIFKPLLLQNTLAGYPAGNSSLKERIVMPYRFDRTKQEFVINSNVFNLNTTYASSGLLSSIKDLATYTRALDENILLTKASYERMTRPFTNNKGKPLPAGFGWFTQRFEDVTLHWSYGYGDSDSALLVRVPDRRMTFIFLSNCDHASAACRLGNGNVLRSPFALAFVKHFVLNPAIGRQAISLENEIQGIRDSLKSRDEHSSGTVNREVLFTQALIHAFAETAFNKQGHKAAALTKLFYEFAPDAFDRPDPTLIHLVSEVGDPELDEAAKRLEKAYNEDRRFQPEMLAGLARRFERQGKTELALKYFHELADSAGFEEQPSTMDACLFLGRHYAHEKQFDQARTYLWRALVYARQAGSSEQAATAAINEVNEVAAREHKGNK